MSYISVYFGLYFRGLVLVDFKSYPQELAINYRIFNIGNYRIYKESVAQLFVNGRPIIHKIGKYGRPIICG